MEKGPGVGKAADGDRCGAANPEPKAAQTHSTGTAGPHVTRYPTWLLLRVWGFGGGGGWEHTEGLRSAGLPASFLALRCCRGEGGTGTPAPLFSHRHVTEARKAGRWGVLLDKVHQSKSDPKSLSQLCHERGLRAGQHG